MTDLEGILARALNLPVSALASSQLAPVKVAVIDSGVDATHPDLAGRVDRAVNCLVDAEGRLDIVPVTPGANNDTYGHGTAIASVITRIAPNTTVIDIKVLGNGNNGAPEALLGGIGFANSTDAILMNVSVAVGEAYLPRLVQITDTSYRRNKIVVAATRNDPMFDEGYPASIASVIGVGNAGRGAEDRWRYQRAVIEYMGHGVDVPIALAGGGYSTKTGTSLATPLICGVVALLLGAHPGLTPFEIKALLKAFAAAVKPR